MTITNSMREANVSSRDACLPLLLTEAQVEARFGLNRRTLQHWRQQGDGPAYAKVGRSVRYTEAEILTFIDQSMRRSTSVALADAQAEGMRDGRRQY